MSNLKKGIVVISVDDGRKDAYRFYKEILLKNNIPATFNIVTAWIDTSDNKNSGTLTLAELKEMSESELCEIAAHGHTHKNEEADILKSRDLLCEWLGINGKIGFASPGSDMKNDFIRENEQKLSDMGLLYVRSGRTTDIKDQRHIDVFENAKSKGICGEPLDNTAQLAYEYNDMCVNSAIVFNYTSVNELKQITEIAMEEKACIVLMLHGVTKKGETEPDDLWCFDYDKCAEYAEYLSALKKEGRIEVLTTKDAYLKLRK